MRQMKNFLKTLILILSLYRLSLGGTEEQANNFDWTAYSFELPNHSPVRHLDSSDDERTSSSQHKDESSGPKQFTPLRRIKSPIEEMKAKMKIANKRRYLRRKAELQQMSPEEQEQERLAEKARQKKHYNKNKRQSGFTTIHNARLNTFRILEKNGKATQKQLEYLQKDKEKVARFYLKKQLVLQRMGQQKVYNHHFREESDWRSYLNLSPEHMPMQDLPSEEEHHMSKELSPILPTEASHEKQPFLSQIVVEKKATEKHKDNYKPSLTQRQRYYRNWKAKKETLPEEEKASRKAKEIEKYGRYRKKMRTLIGYSTKRNANMHQIRKLEKIGKASVEQLELLEKERNVRRIYARRKREEKRASGIGKERPKLLSSLPKESN
ncbi:uncharacterized protein FA14DRAFT_181915 [Meira miltonrushii]|uniref:ALMS motif domain-containing protein n=1 Tax=Meira miltonrushii TaxID=1280837 RepID=A0A316V363_9BASI|nr:uncharacterized protein FA14DRAFT_181915 [Meira miltonrushii]PWN31996.1 hypothetical protein FA14DRAFT_181915 [Meira miltonrushii]